MVVRLVTQQLSDGFKVPFVVDNKPGAGGGIGAQFVSRAAPDGYTLLLTSSSTMSINPHLNPKLGFDPVKSFTPIAFIGYSPNAGRELFLHAEHLGRVDRCGKSQAWVLQFCVQWEWHLESLDR